jgi:hypothetical protein
MHPIHLTLAFLRGLREWRTPRVDAPPGAPSPTDVMPAAEAGAARARAADGVGSTIPSFP